MALPAEDRPRVGISLFTGIGGLDLGIAAAFPGARPVLYVERELYVAEVLVARMEDGSLPEAPIWSDIETLDGHAWRGRVDYVSAGWPCPPVSHAGRRAGRNDPRWLWPHVARILGETQARWFLGENVAGLLNSNAGREFSDVLSGLDALGYDVEWGLLGASDVGAPHRRERVFILARRRDVAVPVGRGGRAEARHAVVRRWRSPGDWPAGLPDLADGPTLQLPADRWIGGTDFHGSDGEVADAAGERCVGDDLGVGSETRSPTRELRAGSASPEGSEPLHERGFAVLAYPEDGAGANVSQARDGRAAGVDVGGPGGAVADPEGDLRGAPGNGGQGAPHRTGDRAVGYANRPGLEGLGDGPKCEDTDELDPREAGTEDGPPLWPPCPGEREQWARVLERWPHLAPATVEGAAQLPIRKLADGLRPGVEQSLRPSPADALRAIGNAVVPAQAAVAFRELYRRARGVEP